jgi:hypothetical protein
MLRDALSQLSAEVRWARDQAAFALHETEEECKRLAEEYAIQNSEWEAVLESSNVKFAESTAKLNTAEENLRQKVMEANDLLQQLGEHRKDCAKKIKEGAETICGIKSIRQELYQMQSYNPFIQDCEVGEWQPGECSAECGGGERAITREVVTPAANGGAECPPMIEKEPCNLQPGPIDCVVGEWSEYSACSKDCGGGVEVRSRPVFTDVEHGGEPCGDLSEQNSATWMPAIAPASWTRSGLIGPSARSSATTVTLSGTSKSSRKLARPVSAPNHLMMRGCRQLTATPRHALRISSAWSRWISSSWWTAPGP